MKRKIFYLFGLLPILVTALALVLFFGGCAKTPTEAPTTTVKTGSAQVSVSSTSPDTRDSYSFSSGGVNYGKITLVYLSPAIVSFEANGILVGSGTTAPETGYGTTSQVALSYRYFVKTDNAVHYARVDVTSKNENASTGYITVGFNWALQTEANNRSL
jgi:hypothetical protein